LLTSNEYNKDNEGPQDNNNHFISKTNPHVFYLWCTAAAGTLIFSVYMFVAANLQSKYKLYPMSPKCIEINIKDIYQIEEEIQAIRTDRLFLVEAPFYEEPTQKVKN
jgi:hypothetical protein